MIKGHTLHSDYALGCRLPLEQWTWLNRTGAFEQPSLRPYVAPFPPLQLMENVSGLRNEQDFASHGVDLYAAVSMISPKPLTEYRNILDFGCGCGRLSRMFKGHPHEVSGCDIDKRHVEWVSKNIDFMTASVSSIHPPLPYPSNHFDCVISISVFSHLSEKSQDEFLADLCRISQPGAYLFVSVHGENAMQRAVHEKPIREMLVVEEAPFQEAQQRLKQGQHAFILQKGHLTNTAEDRARFPFFRK